MQVKTFPITLEAAFMISSKVKHFIFKARQEAVFNFLPGQFITIHFDKNGKSFKRSYSIANAPRQDNIIEFAAGYFPGGPGTDLLFNLKPGEQININGPFGRLILKDESPKRYILLATSTGITPYRSMIPALKHSLEQNPRLEVVIIEGVQKHEEVLYADEFISFASYHSQVKFYAYLSQEDKALQSYERKGYVQMAFPELSLNPQEDIIYLCGNPAMIDDSFTYLKEKGFGIQQIIREKYISAPTK